MSSRKRYFANLIVSLVVICTLMVTTSINAFAGQRVPVLQAQSQSFPENGCLLYTSSVSNPTDVYLFALNLADRNLQRVTNESRDTAYSSMTQDGRRVAFDNVGKIFTMDFDGSNLTQLGLPIGVSSDPEWHPKGEKIVFSIHVNSAAGGYETNLAIYNTLNGEVSLLTNDSYRNMRPSWAPSGSEIVFQSNRTGSFELFRLSLSDEKVINTVQLTQNEGEYPAWSPDGSQIAFASRRDGDNEIYIMDSNGRNVKRLTHSAGTDVSPIWSPDGQWIAFASRHNGNFDIYATSTDGRETVQLTSTAGDEFSPTWIAGDCGGTELKQQELVIKRQELITAIENLTQAGDEKIVTDVVSAAWLFDTIYNMEDNVRWANLSRAALSVTNAVLTFFDLEKYAKNPGNSKMTLLKFTNFFLTAYSTKESIESINSVQGISEDEWSAYRSALRLEDEKRSLDIPNEQQATNTFLGRPLSELEVLLMWGSGESSPLRIPLKSLEADGKVIRYVNGANLIIRNYNQIARNVIDAIPDPLPVDYPVDDLIVMLEKTTDSLKSSMRGSTVVEYPVLISGNDDSAVHQEQSYLGNVIENQRLASTILEKFEASAEIAKNLTYVEGASGIVTAISFYIPGATKHVPYGEQIGTFVGKVARGFDTPEWDLALAVLDIDTNTRGLASNANYGTAWDTLIELAPTMIQQLKLETSDVNWVIDNALAAVYYPEVFAQLDEGSTQNALGVPTVPSTPNSIQAQVTVSETATVIASNLLDFSQIRLREQPMRQENG